MTLGITSQPGRSLYVVLSNTGPQRRGARKKGVLKERKDYYVWGKRSLRHIELG